MYHISTRKYNPPEWIKESLTQDLEGLPKSKSLRVKGHYPLICLRSFLSHGDGLFVVYQSGSRDKVSYMFPLNALVTFCRQTGSRDAVILPRQDFVHSNNSLPRLFFGQASKSLPLQEIGNPTGLRTTANLGMKG